MTFFLLENCWNLSVFMETWSAQIRIVPFWPFAKEWRRMFDLADIPESRLGVLVLYHNGHMPHPVERKMSIDASFAWRCLHRCCIEDNGDMFARMFTPSSLSVTGAGITFRMALNVIRQKYITLEWLTQTRVYICFLMLTSVKRFIESVAGRSETKNNSRIC